MGRASQLQAQESRARIIDSANRLFRRHGADHVSVAQLMQDCGMTVGGFYKHFASKEALAAEVCGLAFTQSARTWDKVMAQADAHESPRAAGLVRGYLANRTPERRCPILAFAPAEGGGAEGMPAGVASAQAAYLDGARALFDKFLADAGGAQAGPEARQKAMLLVAAMVGARAVNHATGNAAWVQEMEAAVNAAAAEDSSSHTIREP